MGPAHVGDRNTGRSCRRASRCGSEDGVTCCVTGGAAQPRTASLRLRVVVRALPAAPPLVPAQPSAAGPALRLRCGSTPGFSGSRVT